MENENNLFIEFVKAEASRPVWHEMFRLRSYGGKRRAAGDLRGSEGADRERREAAGCSR